MVGLIAAVTVTAVTVLVAVLVAVTWCVAGEYFQLQCGTELVGTRQSWAMIEAMAPDRVSYCDLAQLMWSRGLRTHIVEDRRYSALACVLLDRSGVCDQAKEFPILKTVNAILTLLERGAESSPEVVHAAIMEHHQAMLAS